MWTLYFVEGVTFVESAMNRSEQSPLYEDQYRQNYYNGITADTCWFL